MTVTERLLSERGKGSTVVVTVMLCWIVAGCAGEACEEGFAGAWARAVVS